MRIGALPVGFDTNFSAALRNSLSLTGHGTVRQSHFGYAQHIAKHRSAVTK